MQKKKDAMKEEGWDEMRWDEMRREKDVPSLQIFSSPEYWKFEWFGKIGNWKVISIK